MTKRDFLALEDWSDDDVAALLTLAARVKRGEVNGGLERRVMALVMMDPSLRTRASFETAMFLHGGHAVVLEPGRGSWALESDLGVTMDGATVEHVIEAARVLGRYADVLGVRSFPRGDTWTEAREDAVIRRFAEYCDKPVINLESSRRHPCQELADTFTLRERLGEPRGKRFVLHWAWHPKALPTAVPVSAALAAARLGMDIVIARPDGFELDPEDTALIREMTRRHGGHTVSIVDDQHQALIGADAVYAKSWGAVQLYDRPDEQTTLRNAHRHWQVTQERLRVTREGKAILMHCLPVRRNVEIDDAALDGPNAVVTDQAENRLHVQRALLLELLAGGLGRDA